MHLVAKHNYEFDINIPKLKFPDDAIERHLLLDYYCVHGNKKPLKLYRQGKINQAIEKNIESYGEMIKYEN